MKLLTSIALGKSSFYDGLPGPGIPFSCLETDLSTWFAGAHPVSIVRQQLPAFCLSGFPAFRPFSPSDLSAHFPSRILCLVAKRPVSQCWLVGKTIGILPLVLHFLPAPILGRHLPAFLFSCFPAF